MHLPPVQNTNMVSKNTEDISFIPNKTTYTVNLERLLPLINIKDCRITSLYKTILFDMDIDFIAYFIDKQGNKLSEKYNVDTNNKKIDFELNASVSSMDECFLIIKHPDAAEREVSQIIKFSVNMNFTSRFDF